METDITDQKVVLVAPYDQAQFSSTSITFTWEHVADATKYHLQIAKPNFVNPLQIVLDTTITGTSFTHQLAISDYEWRVEAVNSAYKTPYVTQSFKVVSNEDFHNNSIVLNSPANNLITNVSSQELKWTPIIGATDYDVQILDNNNAVIVEQNTTTSSFKYSFPEGNNFWKVRASNGTSETLYSTRSILVDVTKPNTPELSSPIHESITTENDVDFKWNRTAILGSIEKDSIYIYTDIALTNLLFKNEVSNSFTKNLDSGTYYWIIKAFDSAGNKSDQSSVFNFKIN